MRYFANALDTFVKLQQSPLRLVWRTFLDNTPTNGNVKTSQEARFSHFRIQYIRSFKLIGVISGALLQSVLLVHDRHPKSVSFA